MTSTSTTRWRTIDIVVAAVLAVAFGVVFWAWNFAWEGISVALEFYPPLKALSYGVWLIPAVLAPLIIRKIGSGVFAEAIAATISALLGSQWGLTTIWSGLAQGVAGELPFALGRYRRFGLPTAVTSGALAGLAASIIDCFFLWYTELAFLEFKVPYIALSMLSGAVIAGIGSTYLVKALAATGVLDRFPAGRNRTTV